MDRFLLKSYVTVGGATREPGEKLTAAELAGCDLQRLLSVGAIVPEGRVGNIMTRADSATKEELLEEIARLQAGTHGIPDTSGGNPSDPQPGSTKRFGDIIYSRNRSGGQPRQTGELGLDRGEMRQEPRQIPGQTLTLDERESGPDLGESLARLREDIRSDMRQILATFTRSGEGVGGGNAEVEQLKRDLKSAQEVAASLKGGYDRAVKAAQDMGVELRQLREQQPKEAPKPAEKPKK